MDILKRINQLNNERNWSYYKLSEASGVSPSTISSWYSKKQKPSIDNLEKICEGYGITMAQFFSCSKEFLDLTENQRDMLAQWTTLSVKEKERIFTIMNWMKDKE